MGLLLKVALSLSLFGSTYQGTEKDWTFLKEQDGVKVYYKNIDCDQCGPKQEWVVFKMENTNSYDVSASWFFEVWYGGKCHGCDKDSEQFRSVTIPANSSKEGQCQNTQSSMSVWVRFHEFPMEDELQDYDLADFEVIQVK